MNTPASQPADGAPSPRHRGATGETGRSGAGAPDDAPGLPGFRTWRGVYLLVLVFFAAVVIGLTLFSRFYA